MHLLAASFAAGASATLLAVTLGLSGARRDELFELASLGMVLVYALLMVVGAAYALGEWPRARWLALAPVTILLGGISIVPRAQELERARTDQRFSRHFVELEHALRQLPLLPGEVARPHPKELPPNPLCCYRTFVRRSPANELSAVFLVGPRLAYLYDPKGSAWSQGASARWRERHHIGRH